MNIFMDYEKSLYFFLGGGMQRAILELTILKS